MATGLPTSATVEVELNAVWTDISAYVRQQGSAIVGRQGRSSEVDDSSPGTLNLILDGVDGRFLPDSPTIVTAGVLSTNPYYPYFKEDIRIRVTVTKGISPVLFLGWITEIAPFLSTEPTQSYVTVNAVDTLGRLARITLQSMYRHEVLADNPVGFWPLNESSDVAVGYNNSYQTAPNMGLRTVPGSVLGAVSWGAAGLGVESDTSVSFKTAAGGIGQQEVAASRAIDTTAVPGFTFESWVRIDSGTNPSPTLMALTSGADFTNSITVFANNIDYTLGLWEYAAGVGPTFVGAGPTVNDNLWHLISVTVTGTNLVAYLDGTAFYTTAGAPAFGKMTDLRLGGGTAGSPGDMNGRMANAAVYGTALSAARILAHYQAGAQRASAATVASQTNTMLTYAAGGFTSTQEAGYGPQLVGAVATSGKSALDALLLAVRGDSSTVYDNGAGIYCRSRTGLNSPTVKATFDVEADLLGPPTLSRATQNKVAVVTATGSGTSYAATDATLQTQVGNAAATIDTSLLSPVELASIATNRLSASKSTKTRVSQVTVDLMTATNDLYATVMVLKPGDRIRLSNLPQYMGLIYVDGYVLGWTWSLSYDGFIWTFDVVPADAPAAAVFDDGTYGRFATTGATVTGGTAVGNTSNGTVIITTPSGPTWSVAGGSYPMDLDWNGERVTITAAPGGAASPQTLTTTARGVAPTLARIHAANEPIDVWYAARFKF